MTTAWSRSAPLSLGNDAPRDDYMDGDVAKLAEGIGACAWSWWGSTPPDQWGNTDWVSHLAAAAVQHDPTTPVVGPALRPPPPPGTTGEVYYQVGPVVEGRDGEAWAAIFMYDDIANQTWIARLTVPDPGTLELKFEWKWKIPERFYNNSLIMDSWPEERLLVLADANGVDGGASNNFYGFDMDTGLLWGPVPTPGDMWVQAVSVNRSLGQLAFTGYTTTASPTGGYLFHAAISRSGLGVIQTPVSIVYANSQPYSWAALAPLPNGWAIYALLGYQFGYYEFQGTVTSPNPGGSPPVPTLPSPSGQGASSSGAATTIALPYLSEPTPAASMSVGAERPYNSAWWKFTLTEKSVVHLDTRSTMGTDPDTIIRIYDASNLTTHIAQNDDIDNDNYLSELEVTLNPGSYVVRVGTYGTSPGDASFVLTATATPPSDFTYVSAQLLDENPDRQGANWDYYQKTFDLIYDDERGLMLTAGFDWDSGLLYRETPPGALDQPEKTYIALTDTDVLNNVTLARIAQVGDGKYLYLAAATTLARPSSGGDYATFGPAVWAGGPDEVMAESSANRGIQARRSHFRRMN